MAEKIVAIVKHNEYCDWRRGAKWNWQRSYTATCLLWIQLKSGYTLKSEQISSSTGVGQPIFWLWLIAS